jgi:hypothetical protein
MLLFQQNEYEMSCYNLDEQRHSRSNTSDTYKRLSTALTSEEALILS